MEKGARGKRSKTKSGREARERVPVGNAEPESRIPSEGKADRAVSPEISPPDAAVSVESPAAEAEAVSDAEMLELLTFRLAGEEYAVDILKVEEIIRLSQITSIPRVPSRIRGIISLRGTIVPILDLRGRMALPNCPETRKTRMVVLNLDRGLLGFIADEVVEVLKMLKSEIEMSPNLPGQGGAEHLIGVLRKDQRMIILLDIEKAAALE